MSAAAQCSLCGGVGGDMTACMICNVVIHKFCGVKQANEGAAERRDEVEENKEFKCFACAPQPPAASTSNEVEPASQATRSFPGTFGPTRIKPASRVSGPRSALTSFFEEQGITVPRNLHQYARSNQEDAGSSATSQPRRARQAVSDVVADAHRRAQSRQQQSAKEIADDDDSRSTSSSESQKKRPAKRPAKVCIVGMKR